MRVSHVVAKEDTPEFVCDVCKKDVPSCHEICCDSLPFSLYVKLLLSSTLDTTMWVFSLHAHLKNNTKTCCVTGETFSPSYLLDLCEDCLREHFPSLCHLFFPDDMKLA